MLGRHAGKQRLASAVMGSSSRAGVPVLMPPVHLLGTWHSEQPPRLAFLWVASLWVTSLAASLQGSLGSAWGSKGQMLSS